MFRHWHRLRSVLFLAIALQFAQVGAMAHALSHDPSRLRLPDRVALHASLCGECATFGAVLTPGHTANHAAFALEGTGILFSADHVMAWATSIVAPPDGAMADYIPGFEATSWHGLFAPAGTPKDAVDKLSQALQKAVQDPKVTARFADLGTVPVPPAQATPEAMDQLRSNRYSRVLVTKEKSLDDIVGYLYVKDFLDRTVNEGTDLSNLVREAGRRLVTARGA